jgi:hypothetical protein
MWRVGKAEYPRREDRVHLDESRELGRRGIGVAHEPKDQRRGKWLRGHPRQLPGNVDASHSHDLPTREKPATRCCIAADDP